MSYLILHQRVSCLHGVFAYIIYLASQLAVHRACGLHTVAQLPLQRSEPCAERHRWEKVVVVSFHRLFRVGKVVKVESHMLISHSEGQHSCLWYHDAIFKECSIVLLA